MGFVMFPKYWLVFNTFMQSHQYKIQLFNMHTSCISNSYKQNDFKGSTMQAELYNKAATSQLVAHDFTKPALKDCIRRILNTFSASNDGTNSTLRFCDLGSAGGTNAIILLQYIEAVLKEQSEIRPIEYFFEELPSSDFDVLVNTVHGSKLSNQFYPMFIGKSFYEKLFPSKSVHLSLSYITLHWMQNCPGKPPQNTLMSMPQNRNLLAEDIGDENMQFIFSGESSACPKLRERWRSAAVEDLALFLKLRADELHDGGEGIYLMVAECTANPPFLPGYEEYKNNPMVNGPEGSLYKLAFERAAMDPAYSNLASKIKTAQRACFVPYYLRNDSDVMESVKQVENVLHLVSLKRENLVVECGSAKNMADYAWSIHGNSIENSIRSIVLTSENNGTIGQDGACSEIIQAVQKHAHIICEEKFPDGTLVIGCMYIVVRRKPRNCANNTMVF